MSGRSSLIVGDRPAAVGEHVEQLDPCLGVEQAADVLGDLGHVLDDEQARLIGLWHRPDDTTRVAGRDPTTEVPVGRWPGRCRSGLDGEQDRALAAGPEEAHLVVAGEHLDDQPGVLGEAAQLIDRDEPQPVAPDPAAGRLALAALLEDRRQGDARGGRVVLGRGDLGDDRAGLRVEPRPFEADPAVEAGQVRRRPAARRRRPRARPERGGRPSPAGRPAGRPGSAARAAS